MVPHTQNVILNTSNVTPNTHTVIPNTLIVIPNTLIVIPNTLIVIPNLFRDLKTQQQMLKQVQHDEGLWGQHDILRIDLREYSRVNLIN